jgi:GNAT superfamily N-acetyltransferase
MADYNIRRCTPDDATTIAHHRTAMFVEMGVVPSDALARRLREASKAGLHAALRDESYIGWLAALSDDVVIAGVGLHIKPQLPRISDDGSRVTAAGLPLVVNVYTEPAWRQRGIAKFLMRTAMDWSAAQGFDCMVLHASAAGRPLYASLGFVATNEMRWSVR